MFAPPKMRLFKALCERIHHDMPRVMESFDLRIISSGAIPHRELAEALQILHRLERFPLPTDNCILIVDESDFKYFGGSEDDDRSGWLGAFVISGNRVYQYMAGYCPEISFLEDEYNIEKATVDAGYYERVLNGAIKNPRPDAPPEPIDKNFLEYREQERQQREALAAGGVGNLECLLANGLDHFRQHYAKHVWQEYLYHNALWVARPRTARDGQNDGLLQSLFENAGAVRPLPNSIVWGKAYDDGGHPTKQDRQAADLCDSAQAGLFDLLCALTVLVTPCRYEVRSRLSAGFGPGPLRRLIQNKPIFSVITRDRLYAEYQAAGGDHAVIRPHERDGFVRWLWKAAGIDRHTLPRDPSERLRIAIDNKVRPVSVAATWVGDRTFKTGEWDHEVIFDE